VKLSQEVTQQVEHVARNISIATPEEKQFPKRIDMVKSMYSEDVGYVRKPASHFVKSFVMHKVSLVNVHSTILYSNYCSGTHFFYK
jgi:hypothetical protein